MLTKQQQQSVIECLNQYLGRTCSLRKIEPVTGGDINASYKLTTDQGAFFVKTHTDSLAESMYQAEWAGLAVLNQQTWLKVPYPVGTGQGHGRFFFIMEALDLTGPIHDSTLGTGLAHLHRLGADTFGFEHHNYIGTTPQSNSPSPHWAEFWWQQRLLPQLLLAFERGYYTELDVWQAPLERASRRLLDHHHPTPALVHGDLWRGNVGFDPHHGPCLFDPATYYGDREVDLAMTQLFGGFAPSFYQAYQDEWPLPFGYQERVTLYNLYHLLNHLNLFGRGYLGQCLAAIKTVVASAG